MEWSLASSRPRFTPQLRVDKFGEGAVGACYEQIDQLLEACGGQPCFEMLLDKCRQPIWGRGSLLALCVAIVTGRPNGSVDHDCRPTEAPAARGSLPSSRLAWVTAACVQALCNVAHDVLVDARTAGDTIDYIVRALADLSKDVRYAKIVANSSCMQAAATMADAASEEGFAPFLFDVSSGLWCHGRLRTARAAWLASIKTTLEFGTSTRNLAGTTSTSCGRRAVSAPVAGRRS